ncbi:hypothetical protein WA158_003934 [Blastocystis sp. Blastoise]
MLYRIELCFNQKLTPRKFRGEYRNLREESEKKNILLLNELQEEKKLREQAEHLRWEERAGRTTAEKELRVLLENKREEEGGGYTFDPIGYVESCYIHCQGAPRQPGITPLAKGRIQISNSVSPTAFDDLTTFSHIWVIFVFHLNTNLNVLTKSKNEKGFTFPAKIRPPRMKGGKTGLFATRTPHRPNPIGLSVVKVERIYTENKKHYIEISNMDLVDGTPVLDIKPYLPSFDYVHNATVPSYKAEQDYRTVEFTQEALDCLSTLQNKFKFYTSIDSIRSAIEEILSVDVSRRPEYLLNHFCFDQLSIYFNVKENHVIVQKILLQKEDPNGTSGHQLLSDSSSTPLSPSKD